MATYKPKRKTEQGGIEEIQIPLSSVEGSENLVTKNTAQTITAKKTFDSELKFNQIENFADCYFKRKLGVLSAGTIYANLDSKYKDGTWHRMWRLRFPNSTNSNNFWGKIKITLYGTYSSFNASGIMSKSITCNFNGANIYNNVGCYDGLGVNVEKDFRISEAIWNADAKAWEILIWQKNLSGNNSPSIVLECWCGASAIYPSAFKGITAQPVELTQDTTYTALKASPTGGTKTVTWADKPVYENPLGQQIVVGSDLELAVKDVVRHSWQSLTDAQKTQARENIGAGTSNFSGNYNDLSNKPTIPTIPPSLKNPYALKFGSQSYDGSAEKTITAADLGLTGAMRFIGITTTALTDGSTTNPITIDGNSVTAVNGNVVVVKDSDKEFLFSAGKWEELGDESSHALKTIEIMAGTGLTGGGNLTENRTISLKTATASEIGGVKSGTDITVDANGNVSVNDDSHNHVISNVDGLQDALNKKLDKTTYEWNKELSFGSTGKLLIGRFPCYDTNITVDINATTSITYHGILIIATQNINTTGGGRINATVYGDATNTIAPNIYLEYASGSRNVSVYFSPASWSKNLIHIQAVNLQGAATDVVTKIDAIPATATIKPTNGLTTKFAPLETPTFTGFPKAPTADVGTNNTQIATTAFVTRDFAKKTDLFSKDYNDLTNKPTIPTNNNQLENGAGYITSAGSITGNATTATTATKLGTATVGGASQPIYLNGGVPTAGNTLGAAATKGVVTAIDTSANLPTSNAVKTFVEGKGYLTSHQDISGKANLAGGNTFTGTQRLTTPSSGGYSINADGYVKGNWLQTTAAGKMANASSKVCVLDGNGWVYYRTPAEILSDANPTNLVTTDTDQTITGAKRFTSDHLNYTGNTEMDFFLVSPNGDTAFEVCDGNYKLNNGEVSQTSGYNVNTMSVVIDPSGTGYVPLELGMNNAGTAGQVLTSQGAEKTPRWTTIDTKTIANGAGYITSDALKNKVTFTQNNGVNVAGTSKTTYKYGQSAIFAPNGLIMGGTAQAAGLVTRGICGVSTPNGDTGACSKENLYLNYDGNNDNHPNGRGVVINAGGAGSDLGHGIYSYCAVRGDAMKAWVEAKGYKTTDNNTTYKLSRSGANVVLTGSDGTTTSVNATGPQGVSITSISVVSA